MSDQIFDCKQGVGTCLACGKNFECGATWAKGPNFGFKPLPGAQEKFMSTREVYHSSTLGAIPLSFTGRRLMQNMRDATVAMATKAVEKAKLGQVGPLDWQELSLARGRTAEYISQLEARTIPKSMLDELARLRAENEQLRKSNLNAMFGKMAPATQNKTVVLPPIPTGYELAVLGDTVSIVPSASLRQAMERAVKKPAPKKKAAKRRKG